MRLIDADTLRGKVLYDIYDSEECGTALDLTS